ncbi:MAG: hypothetical protein U0169_18875 [Polyangiaceae bacterium]
MSAPFLPPPSRALRRPSFLAVVGAATTLGIVLATAACTDSGKVSQDHARAHATEMAALVATDVGELEKGLPEGAKRLRALYEAGDPKQDLPAVRKALVKTRSGVHDLDVAKSTFFALADAEGVILRNDLEGDAMAGQDVVKAVPALAGARTSPFVTGSGHVPGPPSKLGPDKDFVAASGIRGKDDATVGMLVTGWSYRYFARHLEEMLKRTVRDEATGSGGKMPVVYVAVFDADGVYGSPLTPDVNQKALADLGLHGKTTSGPASGTITITDRRFGWAAERTPKMGDGVGVVVLRSEI